MKRINKRKINKRKLKRIRKETPTLVIELSDYVEVMEEIPSLSSSEWLRWVNFGVTSRITVSPLNHSNKTRTLFFEIFDSLFLLSFKKFNTPNSHFSFFVKTSQRKIFFSQFPRSFLFTHFSSPTLSCTHTLTIYKLLIVKDDRFWS